MPSWGVISPDTLSKSCWDLVIFSVVIYQAVIIPFNLCFTIARGATALERLDQV